ncbi:MAG: hypothetical protein E7070_05260 [Bacteroidales bacterium]|nr:hypothetical protein [Bacteroidales bacterium]
MSIQTKEVLKTYFETGDYPTEAQFAALIDSLFHKTDDTLPLARVEGLAAQLATLRNADAAIRATLTASYVTRAQVLALLQQTNSPVAFVEQLPTASAATMNRLYIVPTANGFTANVTGKTKLPHAAGDDEGDILGTWDDFTESEVEIGMFYLDDDLNPGCVMRCTAIENGVPQWTVSEELAVGDYVWTRDGKCYELVVGRTWDEVTDPYTYTWTASHTPAQTAAIDWAVRKRADELQEQANSLWAVATTTSGQNYIADEVALTAMTVTVTTRFNGTLTDCDSTPSGWTRTATGTYQRSLTTAAGGTVASASFTYTISGGTYDGLTVTKSSSAKSITVTFPCFYGFAASANAADIDTVIPTLTRRTSALTQTAALNNQLATAGYFWIVTRGSATATQLGSSILRAAVTGVSFNSTQNSGITLSGYKVYISTNSAAAGGKFDNVALNISI